jgi:multiple sugar transport system substrate-binding protein
MGMHDVLNRRRFLALAGLGGIGSALAACAPAPSPAPAVGTATAVAEAPSAAPAGEKAVITFLVRDRDDIQKKLDESQLKRFSEKFPNVEAKELYIPSAQYMDKLQTMIAAGNPPDIFNIDPTSLWLTWIKNGTIIDLTDLYKRDIEFFAEWPEFFIRNQSWQGKMYGLSIDGGAVYNLWYNIGWFQEKGVQEPAVKPEESWKVNDFLTACQALTEVENKRFAYHPFTCVWHWWPMTFGGGVIDPNDPTRCILDKPESMEALQFLVDLRWKYNVVPQPAQEVEGQAGRQGYVAKRIAMVHAGAWFLPTLEGSGIEAGVLYPPRGKDKLIIMGTIQLWVIYSGAKHPEMCWEFNKVRIDEQSCREMVEALGSTTPNERINREVWLPRMEKLAQEGKGYKNYQAFIEGYPYTYMWAQMPQEAWDVLHSELDPVWLNQKSVQEYVATTVPKVNKILQDWWKS